MNTEPGPRADPGLDDPDRLASVNALAALAHVGPDVFDRASRLASALMGVEVSLVSLVDDGRQFFASEIGLPEPWASRRETPLSHSYCQYVVREGQPLVITDARLDPRTKDSPAIEELGAVSYCGVPLEDAHGRLVGALCVLNDNPKEWTDEDLTLLGDIAWFVRAELRRADNM